jgi:hypothetical protein
VRFSPLAMTFALPCLLGGAVAMGGCFGDAYDGPESNGTPEMPVSPESPKTLDIDTGAVLTATGGAGVGIFFEVAAGGAWTVFTACDTNTSGLPCDIDVYVTPVESAASISNVDGTSFQGKDTIEVGDDGVVHMSVETSTGLDGMTFSGTAGATMSFEVYLDGTPQPQFIYWAGDGVLHTGSPTDPVCFAPVPPPKGSGAGGGGTGGGGADGGA